MGNPWGRFRITWTRGPPARQGRVGCPSQASVLSCRPSLLNRDILWKRLAKEGIDSVRQVSVDDVWSALRFRPAK